MIVKSFELKKIDIKKFNIFLLYGENQGLKKELIEIFQNHSLNVNIAQNDKLLSKVKKQYENQKLNQPKKNKLSKMISVVILTFALISILKIFT